MYTFLRNFVLCQPLKSSPLIANIIMLCRVQQISEKYAACINNLKLLKFKWSFFCKKRILYNIFSNFQVSLIFFFQYLCCGCAQKTGRREVPGSFLDRACFLRISRKYGLGSLRKTPHRGHSTYRPRSLARQSALIPTTNQPT